MIFINVLNEFFNFIYFLFYDINAFNSFMIFDNTLFLIF